ncbi:MAG: DMT family transporter [Firmicutes bacterium]|nr:DMT family transporter [Bacillota bacterium]
MLKRYKGDFILIIAALMYGSGLVAQSEGNSLGPWTFSATRFLLGSLVLLPIALFVRSRKSPEERAEEMTVKEMLPGVLIVACDLVLMVICQQYGLIYTTVGKAGFITSLYVIGVPIAGLIFLRRKISPRVWIAAIISVIGFYFISLTGGFEALNRGDLLLLIGAGTCVVFVYLMEFFAKRADASMFTCLQFLFTGLFCLPGAFIFETVTWDMMMDALIPILYAGIGICAAGYTFQMIGQKYVPSERATILLSTESLFSLFSGMLILHEALSTREYIGCALIFCAVILAETGAGKEDNAKK